MLIDKSKLYDYWYEDEEGNKYTNTEKLDYENHTYIYHTAFPNVLHDEMCRMDNGKFVRMGSVNRSWNENLVLAMFASGDFKLSEAIKVSTSCCERCLNVLYAKYMNRKVFYKDYLLKNWERACEFCQRSDDEYFK